MAPLKRSPQPVFAAWFSACYMQLRERLSHYGLDEDAFHDTYLLVREKAFGAAESNADFEAYFRACYLPYSVNTAPRGAMSIPAWVSSCGCVTKTPRFRKRSSGPASDWCWRFWRSYAAVSRARSAACSCYAITSPRVRTATACWRSMPGRRPRGPPAR